VTATSSGPAAYTEGSSPTQPDPGIVVTDSDSNQLQGATVSITSNFSSADGDTLTLSPNPQNGITGSYNSGTGVLTLTGNATPEEYRDALRSITFSFTSDDPSSATRTVSFKVTDASATDSNVATRNITVTPTNDAPTVTTTGGNTSYTENDPATVVDGGATVADLDDTHIESAQVQFTAGFESGDTLGFSDTATITHGYNSGTGVLTLTGHDTKANYQAALRSVTFSSTSENPATSKTVEFKVNDGDADSNLPTKGIAVTRVNDAPTVDLNGAGSGAN
jgi:hypothetical protein